MVPGHKKSTWNYSQMLFTNYDGRLVDDRSLKLNVQ